MALPTFLLFLLYSLLSTTISANPLQLNLPSTIALNATYLRSETQCFKRTMTRRLFPTNYADCSNALEQLITSRPLYEYDVMQNFSSNITAASNVWHLPIQERSGTCEIKLSTSHYNDVAEASLAEIHDKLLEEDKGVLRQCLLSPWPLGGMTYLGMRDSLYINVLGIRKYDSEVATS